MNTRTSRLNPAPALRPPWPAGYPESAGAATLSRRACCIQVKRPTLASVLGCGLILLTLFSTRGLAASREPVFMDVSHLFQPRTNAAPAGVPASSPVTIQPATNLSTASPANTPTVSPSSVWTASPTNVAPADATNVPAAEVTNSMDALDDKHRLAIGDRLSFRVLEDEEDPRPLVVTDSGDLEVPYLGRFPAVGKSCRELARLLKAELEKEYYYQATVIVAVDAMARSRGKVYLVGPVRMPGPQEIPSDEVLTVSKAILRAGGFNDFADRKHVKVTRRGGGSGKEDQSFLIDVAEILEKGKSDTDLPLEPGDLIYIPERLVRF